MRSIQIEIPDTPTRPAPLGLLVPIPPTTAHQRLDMTRTPGGPPPARCRALDSMQTAFFLPETEGAGRRFEFHLAAGDGVSPREHFHPVYNRYTRASPELREAIADLTKDAAGARDALRRIVDFTTSLFDYDHPDVRFYDGKDDVPLLLQLTKGSCTDINTFLISSLHAAGLPATYYAGHFFEAGKPRTTTGFHCWVSTAVDGELLDWDIAQHLKSGARTVLPGLNPISGERVAMSCGRGLRFAVAGREVMIAHLAYPVWIFSDGSYDPSRATATLS
jgi:transglutaminase-like putative cysteine protease